jgi:pantothenate kinase
MKQHEITNHPHITMPEVCVQRMTQLLASGSRKILGVVAPPGAGKSTLTAMLLAKFGAVVQMVPMDGFHLANSELERLGRRNRKGAPDTFDAAGYVNLLKRIKSQSTDEVIYAPDYRREIEEAVAGAIAVQADRPLIITEGNYLLLEDGAWRDVRGAVDEIWYLDVPDDLRRARLLARHMRFGRTREDALAWITHTDEPNAVRIAQTRQRASLCVPWH